MGRGKYDFFRSKALVRGDVHTGRQNRAAPQVTPAAGADLRTHTAAAHTTQVSRQAYPTAPTHTEEQRADIARKIQSQTPPKRGGYPLPPVHTESQRADIARKIQSQTPPKRGGYPLPPIHTESQRAEIARKIQDQTPRVHEGDAQRMKTLGENLGATSDAAYPKSLPDSEGAERARSRAAESHDLNLRVNNTNVAIHASNYLDGQTGMRQRAMPYVKSFFSKKAAEELRVGKEVGKELEPIKAQIDESSPEARTAATQAKRGQNASSAARAARGAGRTGVAATILGTGNPVAAAAVGTAAGTVETAARTGAAVSHQQAAESYEVARQSPELPAHLRKAAATEGEHQRLLASRAQRQGQKAAATTMFAATPGAMYMTTGAEQTFTGAGAEAMREDLNGTSRRAEYLTRAAEVGAGESETRRVEKVVNSLSARFKKNIGGISRPEMQAARANRTRALQEAKRNAPPPVPPRPAPSQPKAPSHDEPVHPV